MKYCDKCKVKISGDQEYCPLCQKELIDVKFDDVVIGDQEVFPRIKTMFQSHYLFLKILSFISIVIVVLSVMLNLMVFKGVLWSGFVIAGVICFWISFYLAFHMRKNIAKNMLFQVSIVCILLFLWDYFTGFYGWSINFVIPILCMSNLLVLFILSKIYTQDAEDYMIYLLIGALFGVVPFIFYLMGMVKYVLPSLLCTTTSLLFFAAVLVFQGGRIKEELKKRFHI